jgi:alpha-N-arabinofuranosidase
MVGICIAAFCTLAPSQPAQRFSNPILAGFYPDPSICRVENDYYLVNSTFAYFPGITVFHSRDLVHWELIGHVLDRPEQLNLDKQGVSRGLFAPAIRYHQGTYYVTCTLVDIGGNFVSTAKRPEGPWSDPVWLPEINGIDPSPFFDDNGRSYILYNSVAPDDRPRYEGHRSIRIREFDADRLKLIGEEKLLVDGGTDISRKPVWIEAPHIIKKDGFYYLVAAEGGTADQHSEVVFRSRSVTGPYVSFEGNPILTQRQLDPGRKHPITSTGHADFVQTPGGEWWAVFLGCRPYRDDLYNTGRETFLAPVRWHDGWPIINPDFEEVQYSYPYPIIPPSPSAAAYGGNFTIRDDFEKSTLSRDWTFLRTPHERWYELDARKGYLSLTLRPAVCSGDGNPSFLGRRQQHLTGSASIALECAPKAGNEKAGLLVFQNETHFYFLCVSSADGHPVVQVLRSGTGKKGGEDQEVIVAHTLPDDRRGKPILLKVESRIDHYAFSYAVDPGTWITLADSVDAAFLSTRVAGGFVGCMYAVYATSLGKESTTVADIDWFEYTGDDETYR